MTLPTELENSLSVRFYNNAPPTVLCADIGVRSAAQIPCRTNRLVLSCPVATSMLHGIYPPKKVSPSALFALGLLVAGIGFEPMTFRL